MSIISNLFLEFGADPNSRTASGRNSLHCVVEVHASNLFSLHLDDLRLQDFDSEEDYDDDDLGHLGAWNDSVVGTKIDRAVVGHPVKARRYFERKFGRCERDVLHDSFFEKVRLLIEAGCDPHTRDSKGETPSALVEKYHSRGGEYESILQTWTEALRRCGLDIKDVLAIDQRDLATTTAVDFEPATDDSLRRRNQRIRRQDTESDWLQGND